MEQEKVQHSLLLGVTGKHTRNLSSMRFLVMLTQVPRARTKVAELESESIKNNKRIKL